MFIEFHKGGDVGVDSDKSATSAFFANFLQGFYVRNPLSELFKDAQNILFVSDLVVGEAVNLAIDKTFKPKEQIARKIIFKINRIAQGIPSVVCENKLECSL